ncbi:hypothetical protein LNKW23_00090 [Paralimibaculum aggregatum]|uniref:Uncharacterized protein n=2 Tax=Paralimibaculum aggregatum TaxID=3036245 RepID=A0ABQ6LGJ2_9RHOB|nr:hypothetical protein LNKW23_00090 [Limibaculum sp. NKW23]
MSMKRFDIGAIDHDLVREKIAEAELMRAREMRRLFILAFGWAFGNKTGATRSTGGVREA